MTRLIFRPTITKTYNKFQIRERNPGHGHPGRISPSVPALQVHHHHKVSPLSLPLHESRTVTGIIPMQMWSWPCPWRRPGYPGRCLRYPSPKIPDYVHPSHRNPVGSDFLREATSPISERIKILLYPFAWFMKLLFKISSRISKETSNVFEVHCLKKQAKQLVFNEFWHFLICLDQNLPQCMYTHMHQLWMEQYLCKYNMYSCNKSRNKRSRNKLNAN